MKITIVYDNRTAKAGLKKGWGFSALIEAADTPPLLFDTGDAGASLLYNMEQLGIDPGRIGAGVPASLDVHTRYRYKRSRS
jgi:metal-dependent hydrolase (beta-lactamase superfamily II)